MRITRMGPGDEQRIEVARRAGCYGMWVLTDETNEAALAAYERAGASRESENVMLGWTFAQPHAEEEG